jgi:hypothetical protein
VQLLLDTRSGELLDADTSCCPGGYHAARGSFCPCVGALLLAAAQLQTLEHGEHQDLVGASNCHDNGGRCCLPAAHACVPSTPSPPCRVNLSWSRSSSCAACMAKLGHASDGLVAGCMHQCSLQWVPHCMLYAAGEVHILHGRSACWMQGMHAWPGTGALSARDRGASAGGKLTLLQQPGLLKHPPPGLMQELTHIEAPAAANSTPHVNFVPCLSDFRYL